MKRTLRIASVVAGVVLLLVGLLLVVPFLIDFNRFKPQIQALVSEQVNAKVDFESARLTILTGLGVKLTKVSFENTDPTFAGTRLFAVDELVFRTELWPLFEKKFVGTVIVDRPEIVVVRSGLDNNVTSLPKPKAPGEPAGSPPPSDAPVPGEAPMTPEEREARRAQIEEFKKNIVVQSLRIDDASLTVREVGAAGPQDSVRITALDLDVSDIGADRDIRALLTTQANVNQPGVRVNGPFELTLKARLITEGAGWRELTFDGRASFDKMFIVAADGAFNKPEGVPLHAEFGGNVFPDAFELSMLKARLHNLDVDVAARIDGFARKQTTLSVKAKNADLSRLGDVLPQHKSFLVNASLELDAGLEGALTELDGVKTRVKLKSILTGSDIELGWSSDRIKPLHGRLDVTSRRLDLVSLLGPFTKGTAAGAESSSAPADAATIAGRPAPEGPGGLGGGADTKAKAPAPTPEFELTAEQKTLLAGSDVEARLSIDQLLYRDFKIETLKIDAGMQGLVARLRELSLGAFGGSARVDGTVNLSTTPLAFRAKLDLDRVRAEQVLAFAVPQHKDLLEGGLSLNVDLEGRGSTYENVSKTLDGKGTFAFSDGQLKTESVALVAQEKFDAFVGGLSVVKAADDVIGAAEKILANPIVKASGALKEIDVAKAKADYETVRNISIADRGNVERTLKDVKGTLAIEKGRVFLASRNGGRDGELDFKGSVGLDLSLQGNATFTAGEALEQKMLKQSKYATLLLDDAGNLVLPMTLGGSVKAPNVGIDFAPLQARFTAKARSLAEAELRKRAEEELNKLLKGNANKALSDLKGKAEGEKKKLQEKAKAELERARKKNPEADKLLKGLLGK